MDSVMTGKREKVRNAILIGGLCSISYLAVYFARNILGAVTPQMLEDGVFTTEFMGTVSSVYFICYAVGQLINGIVGDKIKAKYMISFGLLLAGICNFAFVRLTAYPTAICVAYGLTGFFLAMIYGPMTKVVAEIQSRYMPQDVAWDTHSHPSWGRPWPVRWQQCWHGSVYLIWAVAFW